MDARRYYLELHRRCHLLDKAQIVLETTSETQFRTVLEGHNAIAWLVWHIARGEDWAMQPILRGREQLLTRDGWDARLEVDYPEMGVGMDREAMTDLSARINLDALRGYYAAVTRATRQAVDQLDFDRLNEPFDVEARLALAPQAVGRAEFVPILAREWPTPRPWLDVMTIIDVAQHFEEAEHVLGLLRAGPASA